MINATITSITTVLITKTHTAIIRKATTIITTIIMYNYYKVFENKKTSDETQ